MKVIDLEEAKANLEQYANECRSAPIVVTIAGKPVFEMIPVLSDDPEFIDRLLAENDDFRALLEERKQEAETGKVSSLEEVRKRLHGASAHGPSSKTEAKVILKEALQPKVNQDFWERAKALRDELAASGRTFSDSADLIREDRDR